MDDDLRFDDLVSLPVSDLAFDVRNPRLAGFDVIGNEERMVKVLWDTMDVRELVLSIAASGYFEHEPVIVTEEDGRNVVIEGNRRLAAVKLLLLPDLAKKLKVTIPQIGQDRQDSLRQIPAFPSTRNGAWRFLGFKHINGPVKWSGYAKSRFVADVHRNYGVSLDDIARQIGDTHNTVHRLYHGFMVMEQAERIGAYDRGDRWYGRFAFSHLYGGLQLDGIRAFLDLRSDGEADAEPVPADKKEQLRELLVWLYGSKSEGKPPVVQSLNPHLRQLDAVLGNAEALAAMRAGTDLSVAFEASRRSSNLFEKALVEAKLNLVKARGVLSRGYGGSRALLGVASVVADLAYDLHEEMERRSARQRERRRANG